MRNGLNTMIWGGPVFANLIPQQVADELNIPPRIFVPIY